MRGPKSHSDPIASTARDRHRDLLKEDMVHVSLSKCIWILETSIPHERIIQQRDDGINYPFEVYERIY